MPGRLPASACCLACAVEACSSLAPLSISWFDKPGWAVLLLRAAVLDLASDPTSGQRTLRASILPGAAQAPPGGEHEQQQMGGSGADRLQQDQKQQQQLIQQQQEVRRMLQAAKVGTPPACCSSV